MVGLPSENEKVSCSVSVGILYGVLVGKVDVGPTSEVVVLEEVVIEIGIPSREEETAGTRGGAGEVVLGEAEDGGLLLGSGLTKAL